jgi:hypothetical protein
VLFDCVSSKGRSSSSENILSRLLFLEQAKFLWREVSGVRFISPVSLQSVFIMDSLGLYLLLDITVSRMAFLQDI